MMKMDDYVARLFHYSVGHVFKIFGHMCPLLAIQAEPNVGGSENCHFFAEHVVAMETGQREVAYVCKLEHYGHLVVTIGPPPDPLVAFVHFVVVVSFDAIHQLTKAATEEASISSPSIVRFVHQISKATIHLAVHHGV